MIFFLITRGCWGETAVELIKLIERVSFDGLLFKENIVTDETLREMTITLSVFVVIMHRCATYFQNITQIRRGGL